MLFYVSNYQGYFMLIEFNFFINFLSQYFYYFHLYQTFNDQ
jgi:hypothetical protein